MGILFNWGLFGALSVQTCELHLYKVLLCRLTIVPRHLFPKLCRRYPLILFITDDRILTLGQDRKWMKGLGMSNHYPQVRGEDDK